VAGRGCSRNVSMFTSRSGALHTVPSPGCTSWTVGASVVTWSRSSSGSCGAAVSLRSSEAETVPYYVPQDRRNEVGWYQGCRHWTGACFTATPVTCRRGRGTTSLGEDADGKTSRSLTLVRASAARCCRCRLGRRPGLSGGGDRGTGQRADLALLRRSKRPAAAGPLHV
jgi:hypothetical protein